MQQHLHFSAPKVKIRSWRQSPQQQRRLPGLLSPTLPEFKMNSRRPHCIDTQGNARAEPSASTLTPRHTPLRQGLWWKETALDPEGDTVAGTTACHLPGSLLGAPAAKSWRSCEWHLHSTQLASASVHFQHRYHARSASSILTHQLSNPQASLIPPDLIHRTRMGNSVQSNMTDRRKKSMKCLFIPCSSEQTQGVSHS